MLTFLERFHVTEQSKLLLIPTCLAPRFKRYVSSEAKWLARKCVNGNIVDTDDEIELQSKRFCTESSNDTSVDTASTSKVCECFTEIIHDCGATTVTEGRKKVIVNRYFLNH